MGVSDRNERRKAWLAANPEREARYRAAERTKYRTDPRAQLIYQAKGRAKLEGLEFSLTVDDIRVPDTCPLLEIPIAVNIGGRHASPNSPSIDRIDNKRGYVRGNVMVISYLANTRKGELCADELLKLGANLKKFETEQSQSKLPWE